MPDELPPLARVVLAAAVRFQKPCGPGAHTASVSHPQVYACLFFKALNPLYTHVLPGKATGKLYSHLYLRSPELATSSGERTLLRKKTPGFRAAYNGDSAERGKDPEWGGWGTARD